MPENNWRRLTKVAAATSSIYSAATVACKINLAIFQQIALVAGHDMQDQDTDWRTPDIDAGQRIAAADLERIAAKLEKAELALLVEGISRHIAAKRKGKEEAVARFISEAITFCVFPSPCMVNVMGVAYALDLPFHMGRSMSAQARSMGVTRAAISNAAWQFTRRMKIPPSQWLRTEETTENNRKARLKACKPQDT